MKFQVELGHFSSEMRFFFTGMQPASQESFSKLDKNDMSSRP
jgi:hypothetical protein